MEALDGSLKTGFLCRNIVSFPHEDHSRNVIFYDIPETVPVQTYLHLLPGRSPSTSIALQLLPENLPSSCSRRGKLPRKTLPRALALEGEKFLGKLTLLEMGRRVPRKTYLALDGKNFLGKL
ncbi:hypothetical protein SDJN03_18894, partial [Cucurbita argyrosperma subsp. sororia]